MSKKDKKTLANRYISVCGTIQISYVLGKIQYIQRLGSDVLAWDALRHELEFYETDINAKFWSKC